LLKEVVESGLEGYEVSNIFSDRGRRLVSSHFKKVIRDQEGNELETFSVHFNFIPSEKSEARFKVSHFDHQLPEEEAERSLHIDRDERLGGIYIDINTPHLEKVLRGIQGKNDGYGHHFESRTLQNFVTTEKFVELVKVFQDIITSQAEIIDEEPVSPDMLQKLKEHFA